MGRIWGPGTSGRRPGNPNTLILIIIFTRNTVVHDYVVLKTVMEKFSFSEIEIEKVNFFTENTTKIFCIGFFNIGSCLASCLTFRPFLTLDPSQLGCL